MYLNDLNSASHNVDKINKVLANTFGHSVDISEMSTNSLERMLNVTDAKITQIKESDLTYWENPQYNKLHLISHSLRTYINEVAPVRSAGTVKTKVKEAADLEQAEVLLAAREMVDKVQKMVEDLAEMQVQELMPIVDAMKEQIGFETAEAFNTAAEAALGAFLDQAKAAKEAMENATLAASGQAPATPMPTDMGMEPEMDMDAELDMSDDFEADPAAAGEDNATGREMKEGVDVMEAQALKEKKFLEAKSRVFDMLESGKITKEQVLALLSELDSGTPRVRTDQKPSQYGNKGTDYRTMPYNSGQSRQANPVPKSGVTRAPRAMTGLRTADIQPGDAGHSALTNWFNRMRKK